MYRGGGDRPASQGAGHFYFCRPLSPAACRSEIAHAAVNLQFGANDIA
jgi:hypothetical protein